MLLQSFDQFDLVMDLTDAVERSSTFFKKRDTDKAALRTCGQFSFVESCFVAFYSQENALYFQMNSAVWKLSDSTRIGLIDRGWQRVFVLQDGDQLLIEFVHTAPMFELDPYDFTQIEAEDFDFLLWVHNVMKKPERQEVFQERHRNC